MKHPFITRYPVKSTSRNLIIGTHPPMPAEQSLDFFYGNMAEFWRHLSLVYGHEKIYLNNQPNLDIILKFLEEFQMSITDMVYETDGTPFSTDQEMGIVALNPYLKTWLEDGIVETIFFTSLSGKNNAFELFKKWHKQSFGKPLKESAEGVCMIAGRAIKLVKLYSPSPSARRGISGSPVFKSWLLENPGGSVDDFRVNWYRKHLPKLRP